MKGWALLLGWMSWLLLLPPVAWAAGPASGWLPDEVLSGLMLRTLAQTPDGLLWAGTDDGVYRYDGTRLVSINALRRSGGALPTVSCEHLLALPNGQLWLGTEAGLFCFRPDGTLQALPLPVPGSSYRAVEALASGAGGRCVWVAQSHVGLRAYSLQGRPQGPLVAYGQNTHELWPAPDGSLWVVTPEHTRQLAPATGRELGRWPSPGPDGLSPVYNPQGQPWLLSSMAAYQPGPAGQLREVARWGLQPAPEWTALLRSPGGPVLLRSGQVQQLEWGPGPAAVPRPRFEVPLPAWHTAGWKGQLRADQAGHWWVFDHGARGCWRREAAPSFIWALPGPGGRPYSVRGLARLPDGRLLVSTYIEGLLTQARDSPLAPLRPWAAARLPTGRAPVLMGLAPAPGGRATDWLAVGASPLLRFDLRTGHFRELLPLDQRQTAVGGLSLARDPASGRVWVGTHIGLYTYDPAVQTFRPFAPVGGPKRRPPLAGRIVEDVCPTGATYLWLATPEGVERLTLATGECLRYGPTAPAPRRVAVDGARCLYWAPDGRLWVGTRAHGLAVIEPDGRAHAALTPGQGLPNASVATITPGPGGALWLGTYQGLVRYSPATGQLAVFTTAQGLASDECNARAAYVDPHDHSLLVGGVAGLHRIYPQQVPGLSAARPALRLTSFTTLDAAATGRTHHLLPADGLPALRLQPDTPLVDLHLALTNTLDPARARYAYRVPGWLGGRWLGLGTTPQLRLQGLPPGTYVVEVRGTTGRGVPAANVLRLPLTVTAAWWSRPFTWVLVALATSAGVYLWQRGRLRRVRRENALRARLAADLHDEVGALLTRVTMQAELLHELAAAPAPRLATLVEDSRAAASTVRDIIWSVDTGADTLLALTDRIRDYLDATARATGRALPFDDAGLLAAPGQPLPPTVRQHTYRIFKEALTNALKYSPPGTPVAVALSCDATRLTLLVASHLEAGTSASRTGQGLRNMQQRAAHLRANLTAGPVADGWLVRLVVPL